MIIRTLSVFLIFGLSLAVLGCPRNAQPAPADVIPPRPSQSETQERIYLDVSQSMKGFAITGSQYEKSLWELRTFLENRKTRVYLIGNGVQQAPSGTALISDAGRNKDLYSVDQDNLAAGFFHFNQTNQELSDPAKQTNSPDNVEAQRPDTQIYILITDAVQSLFNQSPTEGCGLGADWICVKKEIEALLNQGWAGCVIAVRSQFDGFIFPERDGQRGRFWYRSDMEDITTFRPFYLFMFSPSAHVLAPFSSKLQEAFHQHLRAQSFEVLELTSLSPVTPVNIKDFSHDSTGRLTLAVEQLKNDASLQDYSRVVIRNSVTSPQPDNFILNLEALAQAEADVTWKLAHVYYGGPRDGRKPSERDAKSRYPTLKLAADDGPVEEINAKGVGGMFKVGFQVDWPVDPGKPGWSVYRLDGFIKGEDPMAWINDWSTEDDTTPKHAGKTLFLNRLLGDLWSASPLKLKRRMVELYLWVGPKD